MKKNANLEIVDEEIDAAEEVWKRNKNSGGDVNLKSFDLHSELNSEFWTENSDGDYSLDEETRDQLLSIAMDFFDSLDLAEMDPAGKMTSREVFDRYIVGVQMLGSLASYNYSSYADVDLHLIMDEEAFVGERNEFALNLLKKYLAKCKNSWNLLHNGLNVHGYDVELYVQDVNEENAANGVYSLMDGEWVKKPEKMSDAGLDRALVVKKVLDYIGQIDSIESKINSDTPVENDAQLEALETKLSDIKTKIVMGRREALAAGKGEMCNENIIFKALRRTGHIGKINDLLTEIYDRRNSMDEE